MTSYQVAQWLRQGIAAARAGDEEQARELLLKVVDVDEHNEQAWLWLSGVVESDADREICLENVLAINPDNNLAKAGLVHLRSQKKPPPPPLEPEPEPPPAAVVEDLLAMSTDWWDQSPAAEPALADELLEGRVDAAAAPAVVKEAVAEKKPRPGERRRRARRLIRRLGVTAFLLLGLLAVGVAGKALLRAAPFDPSRRNYANAMRPLLDDYDAWWDGPYGALTDELNSLCGPGADGWRNRDVLLNCSRYPSVDCALLAAHCGSDIDAMRERVEEVSREAGEAGQTLLAAFDAVSPPDGAALAHARFLACLQTRVADAKRIGKLARGESLTTLDHPPACQMFSAAEEEIRGYVGSQ